MKAKPKFMPAPWRRLPDSGVILARNNEVTICDCDIDSHVDECVANANLIAAAPEMYEALEKVLYEVSRTISPELREEIESALRKARGESE